MSQSSDPVVLVDGSSYLYRAYHALPPLTNSKGAPTGAIKGVISMIKSLQKTYRNSTIVVIFDAKGKTFRDDLYKEYKANRQAMPDDLRQQVQPIHDIIQALGLPLIIVDGVEADDVIGTYAEQASQKNIDVIISTGDKDMAQLVNERVTLVNTMTNTTMDIDGVVEKFGIPPNQIIDYLALVGDKVDNIPGVEKCGPKTAVKWLNAYESLQGVIAHADEVKGKIGENLRAAIEKLPLSYRLATIKCDVELDHSINQLSHKDADIKTLLELYQTFEFKNWQKEIESDDAEPVNDNNTAKPALATNYQMITTDKALDQWIDHIQSKRYVAFDTETTSLDFMQAKIVGISVAVEPGNAAYIPLAHDYLDAPKQLPRDETLARFKPLLEDNSIKKVGQNLKYDAHVLLNHGITLNGIEDDTMLESYLLNATANRHDMDTLSKKHLDHDTIHFEDIAGKGKKQLTFNQINVDIATEYAAEDADITLRLHQTLQEKLQPLKGPESVYREIEIPLIPVLTRIEHQGCLIDDKVLHKQSAELAKACQTLEKQAFDLAGEAFNLDSPKQLQTILFEKLEIPVLKKTPKGQPSTAEAVLQELAKSYPLPEIIMQYRSMKKLKSTYTDALPQQINPATGRVHTSYHQAVTATGRLSSKNPNLQNIPVRNEQGRRIRKAFIATEGKKIIAADYSQIELRIMAHLSGDEGLLKAFRNGEDVHRATAAEVFSQPVDKVTDDQRRSAKAINFGLIYGMSAFGLGKQLGIDRGQAQGYVDAYFERYTGVKAYMDDIREKARGQGYIETLFGRRLYLPDINARNALQRQAAERTAINAPMQGTAADIIKRAMITIDKTLSDFPGTVMIMQVHDELVFEVPDATIAEFSNVLKEQMESAAELDVPLIVDIGKGNNWDEAH